MARRSRELEKRGEEWKRKNRERNVYPPPNDGQEWILAEEAAPLFGITAAAMVNKARKLNWRRTICLGIKTWLLKKDIMHYLDFLKDRERWYKRRRPKHWIPEVGLLTGEDEEHIKRVFWATKQASEFLGICESRLRELARQGKIPVYITRKMGRGGKYWFSPTNLRNHRDDEERIRRREIWEKGKATMRQGIAARETYTRQHRARAYKNIPPGWITMREMAERLNISMSCAYRLRRRGRILCEQFTGEWDKRRPWFVHEDSIEEYRATEHYQQTQQHGKQAALSVIAQEQAALPIASVSRAQGENNPFSGLTFGYTHEELTPDWGKMPPSSLDIEW